MGWRTWGKFLELVCFADIAASFARYLKTKTCVTQQLQEWVANCKIGQRILWSHVFTRSIWKPPLACSQLHAITSISIHIVAAAQALDAAAMGRWIGVVFRHFVLKPFDTKIRNFGYAAAVEGEICVVVAHSHPFYSHPFSRFVMLQAGRKFGCAVVFTDCRCRVSPLLPLVTQCVGLWQRAGRSAIAMPKVVEKNQLHGDEQHQPEHRNCNFGAAEHCSGNFYLPQLKCLCSNVVFLSARRGPSSCVEFTET